MYLQPKGVPTKRIHQAEGGGEENFSGTWPSVDFTPGKQTIRHPPRIRYRIQPFNFQNMVSKRSCLTFKKMWIPGGQAKYLMNGFILLNVTNICNISKYCCCNCCFFPLICVSPLIFTIKLISTLHFLLNVKQFYNQMRNRVENEA